MKSTKSQSKVNYILTPLAAFVAAGVGAPAIAQSTFSIEEVLVIAQKRPESIQDVPVAISAFTAEDMENMKMETANDISSGVPNLQVTSPFGETQPIFSIRGQSMADYNVNQASPVGIYVDEAYLGASFLQGMSLFDLERVEVLRGPQGTLYGKNTTGGAINFITREPSLEGTGGYVTMTVGDYGREHIDGAIETDLIEDKLGVRTAFTYTKTDGHVDNKFPGGDDMTSVDTWSGRFSLRYQGDDFDAKLSVTLGEDDGQATAAINEGRIPVPGLGNTDAVGALIGQLARQPGWDAWDVSQDRSEPFSTEFNSTTMTLSWDVSDYTVTSITSYIDGESLNLTDLDAAPWRLIHIDYGATIESFAQDLRIASNFDGAFNFIAGAYYSTEEMEIENHYQLFHVTEDFGLPFNIADNLVTNPTPGPTTTGFTINQGYTQERDSIALYLHTTYDINDSLSMTLGIRYTEDEGNGNDVHTELADYDFNPVLNLITPGSYSRDQSEYDDGEFTGKLGLDYQLDNDTLLYASYSHGYRSSAFNGGAQFAPIEVGIAEPEIVDAFEVGFKTQFRDDTVQLNGAAFYYDYTDQQFVNLVGFQQFLVNGDSSTIAGLELELKSRLTEALSVNAGLGYLDTEFEELTLSDTVNGGNISLDGNELFNAPELNFNLAIDYVLAENEHGRFRISIDTVFTSEQWFTAYNDALNYGEVKGEDNWLSNAKFSWNSADETFAAAIWVKNISENDSPVYGFNLQAGLGYDYFTTGLPRRFGVDFTYRF